MLFLSNTKPLAMTAADGTFSLTLLAFDRIDTHQVEPWLLTWSGLGAQLVWQTSKAELVPGKPLYVEATRLRTFTNGAKNGAPEIHATVTRFSFEPLLAKGSFGMGSLIANPITQQPAPGSH